MLVRPEQPANVGAAARAIRNAGLASLGLVAPSDWRTVECWRTAWGGHDVLERAQVYATLEPALAGCAYVAGLSGKRAAAGALDVRDMAAEVAALGAGEAAALVFGPETSGLSEDELDRCGRRVAIPAHRAQPSLNLAQAVMVAAYEVFRAGRHPAPGPRRATHAEKEVMLGLLRDGLLAIGALPARSSDAYFRAWRALFARADLAPREIRLLEHMARKMARRDA